MISNSTIINVGTKCYLARPPSILLDFADHIAMDLLQMKICAANHSLL